MKSIYVIFSGTDLKVGRLIRVMTRNQYNHASISLDGLETLYSFSRLYLSHPMVGGLVEESPNRYLMSDKTRIKTVKIDVDDNTYAITAQYIRKMMRSQDDYVYNYMSAASYTVGKRIERDCAYTCVEFVRDTLVHAGLLADNNCACVRIPTLEKELSAYECQEGAAWEIFDNCEWGNDAYLTEIGRLNAAKEAFRRLKHMVFNY